MPIRRSICYPNSPAHLLPVRVIPQLLPPALQLYRLPWPEQPSAVDRLCPIVFPIGIALQHHHPHRTPDSLRRTMNPLIHSLLSLIYHVIPIWYCNRGDYRTKLREWLSGNGIGCCWFSLRVTKRHTHIIGWRRIGWDRWARGPNKNTMLSWDEQIILFRKIIIGREYQIYN